MFQSQRRFFGGSNDEMDKRVIPLTQFQSQRRFFGGSNSWCPGMFDELDRFQSQRRFFGGSNVGVGSAAGQEYAVSIAEAILWGEQPSQRWSK